MDFLHDDGGRAAAGFRGDTGDCVTRSIAIATGLPYQEVYDALNALAQRERPRKGAKRSAARTGVKKRTYRAYLTELDWEWTPTMAIGSGCKVHMRPDELPVGHVIVCLSGHMAAVIDGVLHDNHDCSRDGTRCVYGYWAKEEVTT